VRQHLWNVADRMVRDYRPWLQSWRPSGTLSVRQHLWNVADRMVRDEQDFLRDGIHAAAR